MITSPSSLVNGRVTGGRRSSTTSEGRHRRVPISVSTKGRLIRIGLANMASSNCSSDKAGSSSPSSAYGVPFCRRASRTHRPAAAISSIRRSRVGGSRRYSMIVGSMPAWRISASVLREVPQFGL